MTPTQFLIQLSESGRSDFGKKDIADQSYAQKVFTTIFGSSGAIMMDGFEGYFTNSDGESAHFAAEAYRLVGSPKRAEIIDRACLAVCPDGFPASDAEREAVMEALSDDVREKLSTISDEFMNLPEEIDPLLLEFVRKHPDEFGPVPETVT
jgi:hypothetical protein